MGWDRNRPVPWQRLVREWVVYALIMSALFLLFFRDSNLIGALAGILVSGPLYLALGAALAKFGYRRKSLKELRAESREADAAKAAADPSDGSDTAATGPPRRRPAPTSRTGGGGNRPKSSNKRKR